MSYRLKVELLKLQDLYETLPNMKLYINRARHLEEIEEQVRLIAKLI